MVEFPELEAHFGSWLAARLAICEFVETGVIPAGSPSGWNWNEIVRDFYREKFHLCQLMARLIRAMEKK